jgi:hypothetical protein
MAEFAYYAMNLTNAALCLALAASAHSQLIDKCVEPGQVAVLVDLITKSDGPALLRALEADGIQALVTIPQNMLVGKDMYSFVHKIKRAKHQLAYRYNVPGKLKLSQITDTQVTHSLDTAKTRFKDIHSVELKYVVFPYTSDVGQTTRLQKLAEKAGLITVAYNMHLDERVSDVKINLKETMFNPKDEAYIALLQASGNHSTSVLRELVSYSKKQKFTIASFTQCATGKQDAKDAVDTTSDDSAEQSSESGIVEGKKKTVTGVKPNVLVNPEHIRGYKKSGGKHGRHHKHGKHGKHRKHGKHSKKTNSKPAGQKIHAKKAKDDLLIPDPDEVVNPDKKTVSSGKAEDKTDGKTADGKVVAQAENGASAMSVSAMSLLMVAVASVVALL